MTAAQSQHPSPKATVSPSPAPTLVHDTDSDTPKLIKVDAEAAIERGRAAMAESRLADACEAFADALRAHPSLMCVYREIGIVLADFGFKKAAEQCYRGLLPAFLADEWFGELPTSAVPSIKGVSVLAGEVTARDTARHVCFEPRTRPLRQPKGILPPVDRMFAQKSMTSSPTIVDGASGGSLWFDGFNRLMLDSDGQVIDEHTRGNPALVADIMSSTRPRHIPGRAFFVGNRGYSNYYHWMLDILPSIALFHQAGYTFNDNDHVVVFTGASQFQKATLKHLGFPEERIIQLGHTSPWVSADEMIVSFYANSMALSMGDWVPEFLQDAFINNAPEGARDELPSLSKLYLSRATNARNGRSIGNESELIAFLEARGFTTVYPENYTVFEQAGLFAAADVIVAAHGAGLTNIAFCKRGTQIIELYGNFMATCYWALSEVCGLEYYNHCCSTAEQSVHYHQRSQKDLHELRQRGFCVDLGELDALLAAADCDWRGCELTNAAEANVLDLEAKKAEEECAPAPAKRVLFFGFSVTEQLGYVSAVRELFEGQNIDIESRAIGGINLGSIPYFHSVLDYECYDKVVFEVTTCRRYAEAEPQVYGEAMREAIEQVRERGAEPAFIHLFRIGVDYSDDQMLNIAAEICVEYDVPFLNLFPQMVELQRVDILEHFLRDGIHTTAEGAAHYAQAVLPFLESVVDDGRSPRAPGEPDPAPSKALIPVDKLVDATELSTFKRGNLMMPVVEVAVGETMQFDLPSGYVFEGFLFLRTPQAGVIEVDLGDAGVRKLFAFDQHSYYRRYATWIVPACTTTQVLVRQLPVDPEIELVKGERDPGPRLGEICGVLVRELGQAGPGSR